MKWNRRAPRGKSGSAARRFYAVCRTPPLETTKPDIIL